MDRLREPQQNGCGLPEVGRFHDTAATRVNSHVKAEKQNVLLRKSQLVEMRVMCRLALIQRPTKNGGTGGYWLHANRSDSMTSNDMTVAGAANYFAGNYAQDVNGLTSYLSDVGAYGTDSQSYYGTNDQTGNVREWNDYNGGADGWRGLLGGSWNSNTEVPLRSTNREIFGAELKDSYVGFRIASSVPEPDSMSLTAFSAALVARRKRAGC